MTCPHGEADPSCCLDCLEGPPPPKRPAPRAEHELVAQYTTRCAKDASHLMEPGDTIRYVSHLGGWCCTRCAAPPI